MPQKKVSFKNQVEYALFASFIAISRYLPGWSVRGEENLLNYLFKKGSRKHSHLITRNLAKAFPEATPEFRRDLRDKIYRHFGRVFVEITRTFARGKSDLVLARSRVIHPEILQRALQKNRGLIVFSAHFGNWEWIPLILHSRLGKDIHSIARPMDNPLLEKQVREFRETMGSKIIYKQGSLRTILKRLAANEIIYLLIDQNTVPREGVFVDFFGQKASAITTVAQLYLKKNIPVVPVFLHYEGPQVVLEVLPEISYAQGADETKDVAALTQHLTGLIEAQVRKFPEQWLWFHDRWKTRPQGATHESL